MIAEWATSRATGELPCVFGSLSSSDSTEVGTVESTESMELDEVPPGCDEVSTDKLEESGDFETVIGGKVDGASRSRKSGSCPTTSSVRLPPAPDPPMYSDGGDSTEG